MSDDTPPWKNEELLRQKYTVEGVSLPELADEWGTTFDTVRYYKNKFDLDKPSVYDELDANEIERQYWSEGKSLNDIGGEHGVAGTTILRFMEKHDIPRRVANHERDGDWKDKDTLERLYWDEGLTLDQIGERLGCDGGTVRNWMVRHGIEREKPPELMPANHRWTDQGYEQVRSKYNGEQFTANVHQLIAIANGADPYKVFSNGVYHTHHKNGVRWDNRPENIELLTAEEHMRGHYQDDMEIDDDGQFV